MTKQKDNFVDPRTIDFASSSERFAAMYELAERNEQKGKKGGSCNITQCQKHGASSWNRGSLAWYCEDCGHELNHFNPNVMGDGDPMVAVEPDFYHAYDPEGSYVEGEASQLTKRMTADITPVRAARSTVRTGKKVGRNAVCPCTSGLKYKKCCGS